MVSTQGGSGGPGPEVFDAAWSALSGGDAAGVLAITAQWATMPPPARLLRGLANYDAGDFAAAEADFAAVILEQPANLVALNHRALALARLGRRAEAGELLDANPVLPAPPFLRRFMEAFWPHHLSGEGPRSLAPPDPGGAVPHSADYARWQAMAGGAPLSRVNRLHARHREAALKAFRKGDVTLARKLFARARELDPPSRDTAASLAFCLLLEGDAPGARAIIEPMAEKTLERYHVKDARDAAELLEPNLLAEWAWCLHEAGEHRRALSVLSLVRPEGPVDFLAHLFAALCWTALGERENAAPNWDQALGPFFIDSWDQVIHPFIREVVRGMKA